MLWWTSLGERSVWQAVGRGSPCLCSLYRCKRMHRSRNNKSAEASCNEWRPLRTVEQKQPWIVHPIQVRQCHSSLHGDTVSIGLFMQKHATTRFWRCGCLRNRQSLASVQWRGCVLSGGASRIDLSHSSPGKVVQLGWRQLSNWGSRAQTH